MAVSDEANHSMFRSVMPNTVSMLLMTPLGSRSSRQTIAMITAVNSQGMMYTTLRMLRITGLTRPEFNSRAKSNPMRR